MSPSPFHPSATLSSILHGLISNTQNNTNLTNLHAAAEKVRAIQNSKSEFHTYSETMRLLELIDELNANDLQHKQKEKDSIQPSLTALKQWLNENRRSLKDFKKLSQEHPNHPHIKWDGDQSAIFDNEYEMAIILDLICQQKCNTVNITLTLPECPEGDSEAKDDSKRILHLNKYVSKIYETTSKNGYPHESVKITVTGNDYTDKEIAEAIQDAKRKHPQEPKSRAISPRI